MSIGVKLLRQALQIVCVFALRLRDLAFFVPPFRGFRFTGRPCHFMSISGGNKVMSVGRYLPCAILYELSRSSRTFVVNARNHDWFSRLKKEKTHSME